MTQFTDLGLAAPLLKALATEGYVSPTPIQAKAIPHVLTGRDLLGIAQTGTGKTAAFALPILDRLAKHKKPAPRRGARVLVLAPTRELASQIGDSFRTYGAGLNLKVAVVFGGVGAGPQIKALAGGLDVLVATPGRLIDHLDQRAADLSATEVLVLDEVDQMLDLGFIKPIRRIVRGLPADRQNLFFSATMPAEISALAGELLSDPVEVSVAPVATTAERVRQQVFLVEAPRKRDLLVELMGDQDMTRTIIFTRTKRGADKVALHLEKAGVPACAIHGNKSQNQRERSLSAFRSGAVRALVATDIAARGIDIDGVTHVVNFELPEVPESYVHRIGRTARAGAEGVAFSLCDAEERGLLRAIEKLTRLQLPTVDRRGEGTVEAEPAAPVPAARSSNRSGAGRGPQPQRRNDGQRARRDDEPRQAARGEGPRRDGRRVDGHRNDGHRTEGHRTEGHRAEGHRAEGHRVEGQRPEGQRQAQRPDGHRHEGQRGAHRSEGRRDDRQRDGGARRAPGANTMSELSFMRSRAAAPQE